MLLDESLALKALVTHHSLPSMTISVSGAKEHFGDAALISPDAMTGWLSGLARISDRLTVFRRENRPCDHGEAQDFLLGHETETSAGLYARVLVDDYLGLRVAAVSAGSGIELAAVYWDPLYTKKGEQSGPFHDFAQLAQRCGEKREAAVTPHEPEAILSIAEGCRYTPADFGFLDAGSPIMSMGSSIWFK